MSAVLTGSYGYVGGGYVPGSTADYLMRYPTTIKIGDLIVLVTYSRPYASTVPPVRPGWTLVFSESRAVGYYMQMWWMRAQPADVAARGMMSRGVAQEAYSLSTWAAGTYNLVHPVLDFSWRTAEPPVNGGVTANPISTVAGSPAMTTGMALSSTVTSYHWEQVPGGTSIGTWLGECVISGTGGQRGGSIATAAIVTEGMPSWAPDWNYRDSGAPSHWLVASYAVAEAAGINHEGSFVPQLSLAAQAGRWGKVVLPADGARTAQRNPLMTLIFASPDPCDIELRIQTPDGSYVEGMTLAAQVSGLLTWAPSDNIPPRGKIHYRARIGPVGALAVQPPVVWGGPAHQGGDLWDSPTFLAIAAVGLPLGDCAATMTMNVALPNLDTGEDAETMAVSAVVGDPVPHLWQVFKSSGGHGDEIALIGTGLGLSAAVHHTHLYADYGQLPLVATDPVGSYPSLPDAEVTSVFTWTTVPAQVGGYGAGRSIDAGLESLSSTRDPSSTLEHDVVVITVPDSIMPSLNGVQEAPPGQPPYIFPPLPLYFYVIGDGGTSNRLTWIAQQSNFVMAILTSTQLAGNLAMRLISPPTTPGGLEQHHATFVSSYVIESGTAQRPALYEALAASQATLGTWGAPASDGGIPGLTSDRWRPELGSLVPAPDIGTTASRWVPSESHHGGSWVVHAGSSPYIETNYPLSSRTGIRPETAMIFDSTAYADFSTPFTGGFSLYLVVQLHDVPNVLSHQIPLVCYYDPVNQMDYRTSLELIGPQLRVTIRKGTAGLSAPPGATAIFRPVPQMTSQPLIIGFLVSHPGGGIRLYVSDTSTTTQLSNTWTQPPGVPSTISLSRELDIGPGVAYGSMDIVDLVFAPGVVHPPAEALAMMSALDSVYGVVRR